jgi:hypothetical protein
VVSQVKALLVGVDWQGMLNPEDSQKTLPLDINSWKFSFRCIPRLFSGINPMISCCLLETIENMSEEFYRDRASELRVSLERI